MTALQRSLPFSALAALLLAATMFCSSPSLAQEARAIDSPSVALAEQRAAEAFQAYSRKEYAAAVALYLEAYEAAPSGSILYNIARIYDTKLADRPLAITFYRRYIADPGAYTERIEFANQRLRQLREAELAASKAPVDGAAPAQVALEPQRAPQAQAQPRLGEDEPGWSTLRWTGVVVGTVGVAALGTGIGFGLSAMSKASTANDLCDGNACSSQEGADAADAANTAANVSTIGFLAGGALLATGTALFLLGEDDAERAPSAALHWDPRANHGRVSLQVTGKW